MTRLIALLSPRATARHWVWVLAAVGAYGLLALPAYHSLGLTFLALTLVPVGMAGYLLGIAASLLISIAIVVLNLALLFPLAGLSGTQVLLDQWLGVIMMVMAGVGLGWLGNLFQRLRDQATALGNERAALQSEIGRRQAAQQEVLRLNADLERRVADRSAELLRSNAELVNEIQERRRIEATLQASERRFRALIEQSSDMVALLDRSGGITYGSPAAERVLGFSADDIVGHNALEFIHPNDHEEQAQRFAHLLVSGEPLTATFRLRDRCGAWRWVEATASNVLADPHVQAVVINYRDVTERHLAELALQESEERFRQIAENVQEVFYVSEEQGRQLIYLSPAIENVWGRSASELIGEPDLFNDSIVPADRPKVAAAISRQARGMATEEEYTIVRPDGGERLIRDRAFPVPSSGGARVIGIAEDVTERRSAEKRLRASLAEKEVLLKEIHHRVKNNLQVINSLLSLQSRSLTDARVLELLQDSRNRVRSMALVHERLYRSEDLARIDLAEYTRSLTSQLAQSYSGRAEQVLTRVEATSTPVSIDASIACGLILNELVSNALKHAFPDGRAGTIDVLVEPARSGYCRLRVSDTGVGLPEHLAVDSAPSLGLQLVHSLVAQLGGEIHFGREHGASIEIVFPNDASGQPTPLCA